jgi:hypothetical protein
MFLRWMAESGVSRGTRTSFLFSLIMTSAARSIRFDAKPFAMAASVFMEQGITAMASTLSDPLAMVAYI